SHNLNLETLVRYEDRFDEIVLEAAQLALKGGVTTVFDTWGPLDALQKVRDAINEGKMLGSRIFVGGNVIGSNGPFTGGFLPQSAIENVSESTRSRIDERWEQGMGSGLQLMSPEEVRFAVREYIAKDVDFLKYMGDAGTLIYFSPRVQRAIIEESHQAGLVVQAHITSAEEMHVAVEAGLDIVTHGEMSIPPHIYSAETIRELVERGVAVSLLPFTERRLKAFEEYSAGPAAGFNWVPVYKAAQANRRNMIKAGVRLLLSTDAYIKNPELMPEPLLPLGADIVDPDRKIGEAHFNALVALEEDGMDRVEILKAATRNIAQAYKVDADLGTLEVGKIADLLILDRNPLESAQNYRTINTVIMGGKVVNRETLPVAPLISNIDTATSN
ncbi:MAG: hypothetical protein EXR85_06715, partial [Xanthomonadales bacterium]|nr:hypothetical protein [Xanthomonadales bacterium]